MQPRTARSTLSRTVAPLALAAATLLTAAPPSAASTAQGGWTMDLETSYRIRARLSWRAGTIAATETIALRNDSRAPIDRLYLSVMPRAFGELTHIGDFRVDGREVSGRWTSNASLELLLGRIVAPGDSATVELAFAVRPTSRIDTSLEGRLSLANGIMQVSHWFPIVSDGHPARYPGDSQYTHAARSIRLELTTDDRRVRIAAPGTRLPTPLPRSVAGRKGQSDAVHHYEMRDTRDFAFGASPSYRTVSGTSGTTRVQAWYTTGNGSAALDAARSALATFAAAYGRYQWPRLVVAQTGREQSGNEYPGIVFLGGPVMANREAVAHEVAHQWWYAMVGNDQINEPWIDEGLAQFSADHFFGRFDPYKSVRPINSPVYDYPDIDARETWRDPDSYNQTVYYKSSLFFDGLRGSLGNEAFFEALRALVEDNRNGVLTTAELVAAMTRYGADPGYLRQYLRLQ